MIKILVVILISMCFCDDLHLYLNHNLQRDPITRTLFATKDIAMGTILSIEQPSINIPCNFTSFAERFNYLFYNDAEFKHYVKSFKLLNVDTVPEFPKQLLDSLQSHDEDEYYLLNTVHHLSWNSILYPTLPFIKIGFDANIAIFENHALFDESLNHNCIVIMAATHIKQGEELIQPLHFMKKLMLSPVSALLNFNRTLWKKKTSLHLSALEKHTLNEFWDDFEVVDSMWALNVLSNQSNTNYLNDTVTSMEYQRLVYLLYKEGFAPEVLVPCLSTEGECIWRDYIWSVIMGICDEKICDMLSIGYTLGNALLRSIFNDESGVVVFDRDHFYEQLKHTTDVLDFVVMHDVEFTKWWNLQALLKEERVGEKRKFSDLIEYGVVNRDSTLV